VPAGRPPLLTPQLVTAISERVAAGEPLATAARNAGASPRSLRRWRRAGREQLGVLAPEARLELAIERVAMAVPDDWEEAAARLVANQIDWAEFEGEIYP
jgi:transposase-like protein